QVPQKRMTQSRMRAEAVSAEAPKFDPSTVTPPPRPQSSLAAEPKPEFSVETRASVAKELDGVPATSSTSPFVAAARRAQRARQDEATEDADTIIGKALSFVRPRRDAELTEPAVAASASASTAEPAPEPAKRKLFRARLKDKVEAATPEIAQEDGEDE